ncbi:sigma-70 family RNA polymerase sigma factor [Olsenella profusa]|uniref:Sigma-70 family RNA polymerase sigma factor n=2 Tax=Olsenella profusa TaxID=138595 RepID=A0ABS2F070_9ACTN|nr:sigma-70 family RNA polymerase sigma factor [Olsenella profusa]
MRSDEDIRSAMGRHADTVRRLCVVNLKSYADTEDVFQTVFVKYAQRDEPFESAEHERAWFVRVTINACRDLLRSPFRRRTVPLDEVLEVVDPSSEGGQETREVLAAVLALPRKYRDVVYLHYYEGYSAPEIARLLGRNVNTVYTNLTRARERLRDALGGELE